MSITEKHRDLPVNIIPEYSQVFSMHCVGAVVFNWSTAYLGSLQSLQVELVQGIICAPMELFSK